LSTDGQSDKTQHEIKTTKGNKTISTFDKHVAHNIYNYNLNFFFNNYKICWLLAKIDLYFSERQIYVSYNSENLDLVRQPCATLQLWNVFHLYCYDVDAKERYKLEDQATLVRLSRWVICNSMSFPRICQSQVDLTTRHVLANFTFPSDFPASTNKVLRRLAKMSKNR